MSSIKNEQKIHNILGKSAIAGTKYEKDVLRLLKYLYNDIYILGIEKEREAMLNKIKNKNVTDSEYFIYEKRLLKNIDDFKKKLSNYIEGEESILTYLSEMCFDGKEEFLSCFFSAIRPFLNMLDYQAYDKNRLEVISYIFNIYSMLKGYHEYHDDLDNFSAITGDCSNLINYEFNFPKYASIKIIIDSIIENKDYKDIPSLRERLKKHLADDCYTSENNCNFHKNYYDITKKICQDKDELLEKGIDKQIISIDNIIENILPSDYRIQMFNDIYYDKMLLFYDRFTYLNDKLKQVENSIPIRQEIFNYICSINNYKMFLYLNEKYQLGDSFVECMELVFDSNTYKELIMKIEVIKTAADAYNMGIVENADAIFDDLKSDEYIEVIDGKKFVYNPDCTKPDTIVDRMNDIYNIVYPDFSLNIATDCTAISIDDFYLKQYTYIHERKTEENEQAESERLSVEEGSERGESSHKTTPRRNSQKVKKNLFGKSKKHF